MTGPYVTKAMVDGREVELRLHEPTHAYDSSKAKRVKVVVFDVADRILAVRNKKVIDLPGGPVEWDDDTIPSAARREVLETTGTTLGSLMLAAVIAVMRVAPESGEPTYTLVLTSRAIATGAPRPMLRTHRYAFLEKEKLLQRYNAGNPVVLRKLIEMAEFAAPNEVEQPVLKRAWKPL